MAKKKSSAQRTPRAVEPRMYGDGKPSQPGEAQPAAPAQPVKTASGSAQTYSAGRAPATRTAGATPRGAGAGGSFTRVDKIVDYTYVMHDLRRLGITAAAILAGLIVLGFIIR
jgi:hypothetical protein